MNKNQSSAARHSVKCIKHKKITEVKHICTVFENGIQRKMIKGQTKIMNILFIRNKCHTNFALIFLFLMLQKKNLRELETIPN